MNLLSIQNLNGLGRNGVAKAKPPIRYSRGSLVPTMRRELEVEEKPRVIPGLVPPPPVELEIEPPPINGDDVVATSDRIVIEPHPGEPMRVRRSLERGELYRAVDAYRRSWPYTPSNDARYLPKFGRPTPILPVQRFDADYPHEWIPYEKMRMDVSTEMGPVLPGWVDPYHVADEKKAAKEWAMPSPWSAPESMATDVSGLGRTFGDFLTAQTYAQSRKVSGLGQEPEYYTDETNPEVQATMQAATQAVSQQAQTAGSQAAAAGASSMDIAKIIGDVIKVGSQVAAPIVAAKLAQKGVSVTSVTTLAPSTISTSKPFYTSTPFIIGLAGLLGLGAYAAFSGGGPAPRRRSRPRRRR